MDYADESYTAKKLSIRSGTTQHDLFDVAGIELNEPNGWCSINLMKEQAEPSEHTSCKCGSRLCTKMAKIRGSGNSVSMVRTLRTRKNSSNRGDDAIQCHSIVQVV